MLPRPARVLRETTSEGGLLARAASVGRLIPGKVAREFGMMPANPF
jgi:hypothetical protein